MGSAVSTFVLTKVHRPMTRTTASCPARARHLAWFVMFVLYVFGTCLALDQTLIGGRSHSVSCSHPHRSPSSDTSAVHTSSTTWTDRFSDDQSLRLEYIKLKILKKIGLKQAPLPCQTNQLRYAYEQLLDIQRHELYDPSSPADSSNDSPSSASQSDSYDEESLDRLFIFPIKENKLIFNLTVKEGSNSVRGNLRRALLNLKLKDVPVKSSPNISIHVLRNLFDVEGTQLGWAHPVSRFTPNEPFALDSSSSIHWHKYDFTRLLDLTDNYDVFNTNRFLANSNPLLQVSLRSAKVLSAFITLEYENIEVSRGKRSVDCSASGNPKTCCREQFYVNFTTIGWHSWILQPPGYFANYCKGKCDVSHARYHHTTVLSKYTQLVSLCCSPREMSQISLIYMDEDKYVFQKNLPNMVVESCDCA